jgi:RND family efflux transporter MFP subunit
MNHNLLTPLLYLGCVLFSGCNAEQQPKTEAEPTPIAQVQTSKLVYTDINPTLKAYGTVIALPNNLTSISVPYASRIERVYVSNGQSIVSGQPLITVQPSEDALLLVKQAQHELSTATHEQKLLQKRLQLKLATEHELVTSQLRVDQAKAMIEDLTSRGTVKTQTLKAPKAGIIATINVQQGQRLAAGNALLQWAEQNQFNISLAVEPASIDQLKIQQQVLLSPLNRAVEQPIPGHITAIAQQIDPLSHLLNIVVQPALKANFLLNEQVQGQISLSETRTLVAPRAAVLPDEEGYSLYTVVDKHAVKHRVQLGVETDSQREVISPTLKADDEIVILGNYELTDGMAVEVQQP